MGGEPFDPRFGPPGQVPPGLPDGMKFAEQAPPPGVVPQPLPMMIAMDIVDGTMNNEDGSTEMVKLVRCQIQTPQGLTFLFAGADEAIAIGTDWVENGRKAKSPLTIVGGASLREVGEMGDSPGVSPVGG